MLESKWTLYLAQYFPKHDFRSKRDIAAKLHIERYFAYFKDKAPAMIYNRS